MDTSIIGRHCYGTHDWDARGRINIIGGLVGFKLPTACMFDTNVNSDIFYAWLTEDLLPKTPQNSVIVVNNATFHKRTDMIKAIKDDGHTLEFYRLIVLTLIQLSINGRKLNLYVGK